MRAALAEQLQYTCSADVAANKLLAKIASARNKPNKQTLVLPRAVADLMQVSKVIGSVSGKVPTVQLLPAATCTE
jgi:nucleotidyltransferase/DNA polymerase involved in DNA repair